MRVLNQTFDHPMVPEERAADPLAGGIMRGYQCGMVWGAALAAGAQVYRRLGAGPQAEAAAVVAAQRTTEAFRTQNKHINCRDITGIDLPTPTTGTIIRFLAKSIPTGSCLGMAARSAKASLKEIEASFTEKAIEASPAPVSCSAMLARKMGASDVQTVMAAGLAGGIGLSGCACGALGAAIWLVGINRLQNGADRIGLESMDARDAMESFAGYTNGEFECFRIVGRKFESLADHADHLRAGGCSKIIAGLAAQGIHSYESNRI